MRILPSSYAAAALLAAGLSAQSCGNLMLNDPLRMTTSSGDQAEGAGESKNEFAAAPAASAPDGPMEVAEASAAAPISASQPAPQPAVAPNFVSVFAPYTPSSASIGNHLSPKAMRSLRTTNNAFRAYYLRSLKKHINDLLPKAEKEVEKNGILMKRLEELQNKESLTPEEKEEYVAKMTQGWELNKATKALISQNVLACIRKNAAKFTAADKERLVAVLTEDTLPCVLFRDMFARGVAVALAIRALNPAKRISTLEAGAEILVTPLQYVHSECLHAIANPDGFVSKDAIEAIKAMGAIGRISGACRAAVCGELKTVAGGGGHALASQAAAVVALAALDPAEGAGYVKAIHAACEEAINAGKKISRGDAHHALALLCKVNPEIGVDLYPRLERVLSTEHADEDHREQAVDAMATLCEAYPTRVPATVALLQNIVAVRSNGRNEDLQMNAIRGLKSLCTLDHSQIQSVHAFLLKRLELYRDHYYNEEVLHCAAKSVASLCKENHSLIPATVPIFIDLVRNCEEGVYVGRNSLQALLIKELVALPALTPTMADDAFQCLAGIDPQGADAILRIDFFPVFCEHHPIYAAHAREFFERSLSDASQRAAAVESLRDFVARHPSQHAAVAAWALTPLRALQNNSGIEEATRAQAEEIIQLLEAAAGPQPAVG
ncbi:MAG: hypothetical protein ROO73_00605 [Roseivirga sp.]